MDKLGGKAGLISIALVILVQLGGAIVYLTNLSRDVQNNTESIMYLVENDTATFLSDDLFILKSEVETIRLITDGLLLDSEMNKQITSKLQDVDINWLIERLIKVEEKLNSSDDWMIENKVDMLEEKAIRNETYINNHSRQLDSLLYSIEDLKNKLSYLEASVVYR
jgi:hypothetical protein|tara:strand:- start:1842 stop:2339 length:498 start_codon:yes stop_codon:yes gene_type:complete